MTVHFIIGIFCFAFLLLALWACCVISFRVGKKVGQNNVKSTQIKLLYQVGKDLPVIEDVEKAIGVILDQRSRALLASYRLRVIEKLKKKINRI